MKDEYPSPPVSAWKRRALFALYLGFASILLTELGLRILQYREYRVTPFSLSAEPAFCLLPDPELGFRLAPGNFKVSINRQPAFSVSHDKAGKRVVCAPSHPRDSARPVLLLGCSYTYGFGIDDSLTLASRLQQALPGLLVQSYAVPGFGTVQGYLQLKELLEAGVRPGRVVVNYCSFHEDRNVLTPHFRKDLALGFATAHPSVRQSFSSFRYPFIRADADSFVIDHAPWQELYEDWPLRGQSALVNLLQSTWEKWDPTQKQKKRLTRLLITKMYQLCQAYSVPFVLAALTQDETTRDLQGWSEQNAIPFLDMSLPLGDTAYQNFPYDTHPNGKAHQYFAKQLEQYLRENTIFPMSPVTQSTPKE